MSLGIFIMKSIGSQKSKESPQKMLDPKKAIKTIYLESSGPAPASGFIAVF